MNNPKVSIILPTYNGAKYLRESIDSCLSQTHKNIELIIVDDCSTDQTSQIIKPYQDARIRYIRNEKNMRLPRSLNIGFALATGEYLTWTSDDNQFLPHAIETMLKILREDKSVDTSTTLSIPSTLLRMLHRRMLSLSKHNLKQTPA